MNRDNFRTIGAITGLVIGIGLMLLIGMAGLVPAALFGAGGAVLGGIIGERVHDSTHDKLKWLTIYAL